MASAPTPHPASYRDPAGFVFEWNGKYYRQVNNVYSKVYELFVQSGCRDRLVEKGWLLSYEETDAPINGLPGHYKTLLPRQIPFISYPYEWSFSLLRDAALLTLQINREAVNSGLILKDATPYNIQWLEGRLVFIDTLSFEAYEEKPWVAYRQFCECFLAPLLLMHYGKSQLPGLQLGWPEGIPLKTVSQLLPWKSRLSLHTNLHIHLHARLSGKPEKDIRQPGELSRQKLLNLLTSLELLIKKLHLPADKGYWSGYYKEAAQRKDYLDQKKQIVGQWLAHFPEAASIIDLGTNEGYFAKLCTSQGRKVIAIDQDPAVVERLYIDTANNPATAPLPLVIDLANPSPATGFGNQERSAFLQRAKADLVLALALIHHLAIGRNIPMARIAAMMAAMAPHLIIEFVPKYDPQVVPMLHRKGDLFPDYDEQGFETAFSSRFSIVEKQIVKGTGRILYHLRKKTEA